ncbi:MAG TPA: SurA N-terminal domain-containing protein [Pyrinomonadaceae bacterium]
MLKFLSRMERTRSLIIIGFAILMAASLVFFYAPRGDNAAATADRTEVLASVGDEEITVGDVLLRLRNDRSKLSRQAAQRVINQMLPELILVHEAKRLGLTASDAEVAEVIRKNQKGASGEVDVKSYMDRIGDVTRYEESIRDELIADKMRSLITASVTISEDELQSTFERRNTIFDLVYVPIAVDKVAERINPTDQELRDYYEQNKNAFNVTVPQKKIRYIFVSQDKQYEKVQIPEEKIRTAFEQLDEKNKSAGVEVQQIVLKVARPDLDNGVRAKAEALVAELRKGGKVTQEAFAEVARGQSEDPATAKNGGMLPKPYKVNPNKPDALYDRMVDLTEDTITDAIKYGSVWYIMRRGKDVQKTYEDAKPDLLPSLRNSAAYDAASLIAQRVSERLKETKDIQKVAQEFAAEANMKPAEMIRETPYVVPGDEVPEIGSSKQFEDGIEPLVNVNDVGERTPIKKGFAIPMLIDKKEPGIPEFGDIKGKVLKTFRMERAKAQVEETARNLTSSAGGAANLKAAAEKLGLEAKTATQYSVGFPLGEIYEVAASESVILNMDEGAVNFVKMGERWVVVGATKKEKANLAEFAQQHDVLMQRALDERRGLVFADYMIAIRRRLESEGKIKIHEDQLAKLGDEPPPPAITMPQQQIPQQQTITLPQQPPSDRPTK